MTAEDACPGLLDLHEARDGHVARIRLPGGYATGRRLRGLAALAGRFGNGFVDVTARGNVQIRGVAAGDAAGLARQAAAAGLLPSPAHDRARNITASPLAGLAGHPELRKLAQALDRAVRADPALAALSGRFLFCLDDGTGRAGLAGCDVGLRWHSRGTDLILAGRHTGLRGPAPWAITQAIAAARAFLQQRETVLAATGPGAEPAASAGAGPGVAGPAGAGSGRMAGLPDGGAAVAAAVGGVLGDRVTDITSRLPLGLLAGTVVAGTAVAGTAVADAAVADAAPVAVVGAPLARLTAPQLRLLSRMLRPGEAARLAAAGRVVLPLAGPGPAALTRLAAAGLLVSGDHALSSVTACSGMSCARSLADVRSLASRVAGLGAVHWAGCGRRCGLPADATAVVAISADQFAIGDAAGPGIAGPGTTGPGTTGPGTTGPETTGPRILTIAAGPA
jgi:precorrin-3B synthase